MSLLLGPHSGRRGRFQSAIHRLYGVGCRLSRGLNADWNVGRSTGVLCPIVRRDLRLRHGFRQPHFADNGPWYQNERALGKCCGRARCGEAVAVCMWDDYGIPGWTRGHPRLSRNHEITSTLVRSFAGPPFSVRLFGADSRLSKLIASRASSRSSVCSRSRRRVISMQSC